MPRRKPDPPVNPVPPFRFEPPEPFEKQAIRFAIRESPERVWRVVELLMTIVDEREQNVKIEMDKLQRAQRQTQYAPTGGPGREHYATPGDAVPTGGPVQAPSWFDRTPMPPFERNTFEGVGVIEPSLLDDVPEEHPAWPTLGPIEMHATAMPQPGGRPQPAPKRPPPPPAPPAYVPDVPETPVPEPLPDTPTLPGARPPRPKRPRKQPPTLTSSAGTTLGEALAASEIPDTLPPQEPPPDPDAEEPDVYPEVDEPPEDESLADASADASPAPGSAATGVDLSAGPPAGSAATGVEY